ncbi:MAG: transposase [Calditrichales bacterium]|nr:transposase [Calditrichales bacterium]
MRSRYKIYPDYNMYFITSSIVDWAPLIINNDLFSIILDSFKFCQKEKQLFFYGYVIMPNHFHILISMDEARNIPDTIRDMKRHTSLDISKYLSGLNKHNNLFWIKPFWGNKINKIWQEGYHPKAIISEKMFSQKLNYIHNNPVKQGFVDKPENWKYSSARNYILNDHSLFRLDLDRL